MYVACFFFCVNYSALTQSYSVSQELGNGTPPIPETLPKHAMTKYPQLIEGQGLSRGRTSPVPAALS